MHGKSMTPTAICIPIERSTPGGGFQFLANFERFLEGRGIRVVRDVRAAHDVLFLNSWHVPWATACAAIRANPGARVAHRIDGIAEDYGRTDGVDAVQAAANRLADTTVFQSAYCRTAARERYRVIANDGPVIHNPVDIGLFTPDGPRRDLAGEVRVACVTWSTSSRKGAPSIYETARANPGVAFHLCGRYVDPPDLPNLHHHGVLDREPLAGVLRSCHVLLTYSENEACPNHVLEGLASGLPVLFADSGATPELVGDCGGAVTVDGFAEAIGAAMSGHEELSRLARERAIERFSPDVVFPRYLDAITATAPAPGWARRRALRAWADLPVVRTRDAGTWMGHLVRRIRSGVGRRLRRSG